MKDLKKNLRHSDIFAKKKLAICCLIPFLLIGCNSDKKSGNLDKVIFISLDTQRSDYISFYNETNAKTPNIDFFAKQGFVSNSCYSLIPITAPAHASLFYSLPPHKLGLYNNGQVFDPEKKLISLAEIFKKKGYKTAAFISLGVLQSKFKLNRGFDLYEDSLPAQRWYLHAQEINEKVYSWLSLNKDNPFFIWIHYSDPHHPYAPPSLPPDLSVELNGEPHSEIYLQKYESLSLKFKLRKGENHILFQVLNPFPDSRDQYRASLNEIEFEHPDSAKISFEDMHFIQREQKKSAILKNRGVIKISNLEENAELIIKARGNISLLSSEKKQAYQQEVEYMDYEIGKLTEVLKKMELLEKSLVILVGDHGEGLGEDRSKYGDSYFGHIHYLYDFYMRVPMIIYDPRLENGGQRIKERTTILDVAPTLLGLMKWKKEPFYLGNDLLEKRKNTPFIFEETYAPEAIHDRFGILFYPWHIIHTPGLQRFELYNLEADPSEREDVFEVKKSVNETLILKEKVQSFASDILRSKKKVELDPRSLEMLKSLGYIR